MSVGSITATLAIPTYRREQVLLDTLAQVRALRPGPLEVLVIDQTEAHLPETAAALAQLEAAGAIRVVRHGPPSLPGARNRALREARGDVVVFIDDDVELPRDFLARHLANYVDAGVVAVAGQAIQARGAFIIEPGPGPGGLFDYRHLDLASAQRHERVANFAGCNHSVRRDVMVALGGYDEAYLGWAYREDTDAALRLWKAGRRIVFDPAASLRHLAAPSGGCRMGGQPRPRPEWTISFPANYFAWRHLMGTSRGWTDLLVRNVRRYVLRRENALRPWRLPMAAACYAYAVARACQVARRTAARGLADIRVPAARRLDRP